MNTLRTCPLLTAFSAMSVLSLSAAEPEVPGAPLIPRERQGWFLVERLDLTTFRSSLGPSRSKGMRHFSDLGMKPTKVGDKLVEFDSDDWLLRLTILERADKNGDGIEDLVVQVDDQAKKGSYNQSSKLLLTRFSDRGDLIAIAFEP